MAHGVLPDELVGRYRRVKNWIGGPSSRQAAYVPPPADHLARLVGDLIRVTNTSTPDSVSLAAVVHAQFEAIHPYGDGNGRLGRVLLGWVLARRAGVAVPPRVSVVTARAAIETLAARGILQPLDIRPPRPGRPAQWWMAAELVSVVSRWSR